MQSKRLICALVGCAGLASPALADGTQTVIISEIYSTTNQSSGQNERIQEFVELYNYGVDPVDITDWTMVDDGTTQPFPAFILQPGEAVVIFGTQNAVPDPINVSGDRQSEAVFDAVWGPGINRLFLTPFESLSNSPSSTNEILQIFDADNDLVDEVNYDDTLPWPTDVPDGASRVFLPEFLDPANLSLLGFADPKEANDNGLTWRRADLVVGGTPKTDGTFNSNQVFVSDIDFTTIVPSTDPNAVELSPAAGSSPNIASPGFVDAVADAGDCNANTIDDDVDIAGTIELDLDENGIPDNCEGVDCNSNGLNDVFDILQDPATIDCDLDGVPDSCQIDADPSLDLDGNGRLDTCDVGDLIITEIMFNPADAENESEWVEVYNAGSTTVNLDGWGTLKTEAGTDEGFENVTDPASGSVTLAPGEVAVFINDYNTPGDGSPSDVDGADLTNPITEFETAWNITPGSVKIVALGDWGFLANNASNPGNEVLTLYASPNLAANQPGGVAPTRVIVDTVDYDADLTPFATQPNKEWPGDTGDSSYSLSASALDAISNNTGGNWMSSIDGINGAYSSLGSSIIYSSNRTQGSPGFVQTGADQTDAGGEILISEIYAVPNSPEVDTGFDDDGGNDLFEQWPNEWVELYNPGAASVDISGWFLRDEDGFTEPFPSGTLIAPGEAVVIFGIDEQVNGFPGEDPSFGFSFKPDAQQAFYDAWGCGYQVIPVRAWDFDLDLFPPDSNDIGGLSNGPHRANEVLTLRRSNGTLVDIANFEDLESPNTSGDWPNDPTGLPTGPSFSIFVSDVNLDTLSNNDGFSWFPAIVGEPSQPEVRNNAVTPFFTIDPVNMLMEASPGIVPGGTPLDLGDCPTLACSICDCDANGVLNLDDIDCFVAGFLGADIDAADCDGNGVLNLDDIDCFVACFLAGCP